MMGKTGLRNKVLLLIILIAAAALRLWGINFGLPYQFHRDEPIMVHHALAYGTGDLNPHFFEIPPLGSYILFFFYAVYFLLGKLFGFFQGREDFAISFFKDPTPFYLIGRCVLGVLPGILNVALTYVLCRKVVSENASRFACAIMSLSFSNVVNSHYIYVDTMLLMFVLASFIAFFNLLDNPNWKNYILSAVFAGLAVSAKYNAALVVPAFLAAHFIICRREGRALSKWLFDYKLIASFAVLFSVFIISNPFFILDWRFFAASRLMKSGGGYVGWLHHIVYSLFEGVGLPVALFGISGLLVMIKVKRKESLVLLSFLLPFYLHLALLSQPYSRYALVMTPFLFMGCGFLIYDFLYSKAGANNYSPLHCLKSALVILSIVLLILPFIKSVKADILLSSADTRVLSAKWLEENVSPRAKIAIDEIFYSPAISQGISQLLEKKSILGRQHGLSELKGIKLGYQIEASRGKEKAYEIYYLAREEENAGQFLSIWPALKYDFAELYKRGIDYVIFTAPPVDANSSLLHKKVQEEGDVAAKFSPYKDGVVREPYDLTDNTALPVTSRELFSRRYTGPCITIYKLKR